MKQTIGIVGGGQLGRMLSEPAIKLGFNVVVIDPTPDCPAYQVGAEQITAGYKDPEALSQLLKKSDYLTIEFEHINAKALSEASKVKPVNPDPGTIEIIQDKYRQKQFLRQHGLPTADFVEINSLDDAQTAYNKWNGKLILKAKTDSFDGRGNALITQETEIETAIKQFSKRSLYGERVITFKKELAVMVAKDTEGNIISYPVVETCHERNICVEVTAPALIDDSIAEKAKKIAEDVVMNFKGAGVYGVELFLDESNEILINEIAPRVHNSGHYTMDMFDISQFEQHILAISGQSLRQPQAKAQYCCMVNILGERDGPTDPKGLEEARKISGVSVYVYGKKPTKIDRKMGHINAVAGTMEEAIDNARKARELISI